MEIKRANNVTFRFRATSSTGVIINNLSTVSNVEFLVKKNLEDPNSSAVIKKTYLNGITVDDPDLGYIKVALTDIDTEIDSGVYFFGLRVSFPSETIDITIEEGGSPINTIEIKEQVIDP